MDEMILIPGKCYQIVFADGQTVDFKFKEYNETNDTRMCEERGGETFFLDTMTPFEKIVEIIGW